MMISASISDKPRQCAVALVGWILMATGCELVAASSTSSSSSYTSIRALDQFGHSVQLKHAREAAIRHGRLVVAASNANGTVVVVSLGDRPMVHSITLQTLEERHHTVALCCTGVKGDANWLIGQIQQHVTSVWERYNHHPLEPPALAHVVARLLGSFNGEDLEQEWQSSIARESHKWARPLGVQTMILSTLEPNILMIEPSGRVLTTLQANRNWSLGAMGQDSSEVQEKLQRLELGEAQSMDASKLKESLIKMLVERGSSNERIELMIEILTPGGIERTLLQYNNGKEISSIAVGL